MTYPDLPRCQYCGDMFLTAAARDIHEPKCSSNPNRKPSTVESSE